MIEGERKREPIEKGEGKPIELRFAEIYKSPEWKKLSPLVRAELVLVIERVKPGAIISFISPEVTNFPKIIEKTGLEARPRTHPSLLEPTYTVSTPENISTFFQKLILAEGTTKGTPAETIHRIYGEFLGYPSCCIDEYAKPSKNLEERKKYPPDISNFGYEMIEMREKGEKYPEELDYCPPTFTPCSVHCEKASERLKEWKEVMQKADPEAADALKSHNWNFEPYRKFHEEEREKMGEEWWEKRKIELLRESILGSEQLIKEKEIEKRAGEILEDLGLSWENLEGKKVLDVGAGLAEVAEEGKKRGVDIVSLEKYPERAKEEGEIPKDISYIQAEAEALPFKDEIFDLVISHGAPPTISQTKGEVINITKEVERILKEDGEFRFGPSPLLGIIFEDRELFTQEEEDTLSHYERIARIKEKSLEFLKSINPDIIEEIEAGKSFYVLKKVKKGV